VRPDQSPRRAKRPAYEIEFYETEDGDQPARRWMREELTPTKRRAIGTAMNRILAEEGVNVCSSEWGKALGDGLYEFRLRDEIQEAGVSESILLRVFFHAFGDKIILLLGGYDKGEHPSSRRQQREIAEARRRLADFQARRRRRPGLPRGAAR
jgi:phage-related protein